MSRDATDERRRTTNDERRTREDRATQPLDAGWLSLAINLVCEVQFQPRCLEDVSKKISL